MTHEILFLGEVAQRLRLSTASINRLLSQRRKGVGTFPLPISGFKGRGRWLASDIDAYIESLSGCNAAANVPAKGERQKAREFADRQKRAKARELPILLEKLIFFEQNNISRLLQSFK